MDSRRRPILCTPLCQALLLTATLVQAVCLRERPFILEGLPNNGKLDLWGGDSFGEVRWLCYIADWLRVHKLNGLLCLEENHCQ